MLALSGTILVKMDQIITMDGNAVITSGKEDDMRCDGKSFWGNLELSSET